MGQLGKVRRGGTAEANLLFPMFTAGCDAREGKVRGEILERLRAVEGSGMTQVSCSLEPCLFLGVEALSWSRVVGEGGDGDWQSVAVENGMETAVGIELEANGWRGCRFGKRVP